MADAVELVEGDLGFAGGFEGGFGFFNLLGAAANIREKQMSFHLINSASSS